MSFITKLRAAWLFATYAPSFTDAADSDSFWTSEDAKATEAFFNSTTGNKLKLKLNNYAINAAVAAVRTDVNNVYRSGIAGGIHMGISAIYAHFPQRTVAQEEAEEETSLDGALGVATS